MKKKIEILLHKLPFITQHRKANIKFQISSVIKMSRRNTNVVRKPCCKVCKDSGKSESEYSSHWPKDSDGKTVCPTLLAQECRYCGESGHTVKYCKVLERDNAMMAKRERQVERVQKHVESKKPAAPVAPAVTGRFALLMDDDSDESPRHTQKKAPVKEEFPALGGSWSRRPVAAPMANVSFVEMAVKSKEVALSEKKTRETRAEEERLGRAIATGMVIIERGSQGVVMTAPPKTAAQIARDKFNSDCFNGRNGLGWADVEDSDDEDDGVQYQEDAW
jgi:hypothetical protein